MRNIELNVCLETRRHVRLTEFRGKNPDTPGRHAEILSQKKSQGAARDDKLALMAPEFEGCRPLPFGLRQARFQQWPQRLAYPQKPDMQLAGIKRRHLRDILPTGDPRSADFAI